MGGIGWRILKTGALRSNTDGESFRRHGLNGTTKQRVFDALFEKQDGRCFICGISQEQIIARYQERYEDFHRAMEEYPADHWVYQHYQRKIEEGPAPVHRTLHIDHCHTTGMIRGLLCEKCNGLLGRVENFGLFEHYSTPAYQYKPLDASQQEQVDYLRWHCDNWLERHRDIILLYMQPERWLPRKDILFHLMNVE